jgi:hypothetical protein
MFLLPHHHLPVEEAVVGLESFWASPLLELEQ